MLRILFFILFFIPSLLFAQAQGNSLGAGSNLTGVACRVNEAQSDLGATEGEANFCGVDTKGNVLTSLSSGVASATNPIKLEDSVHTSGDAGMFVFGVRNESGTALAGSQLDYSAFATNRAGALYIAYNADVAGDADGTSQPVRREDSSHTSTDAGFNILGVTNFNSFLNRAGSQGDYTEFQIDGDGRLAVNSFGSAPSEMFSTCSGNITTTATTAIKAAVASTRFYITAIGCNNSASVDSTLTFSDGATPVWQGAINKAATKGEYNVNFPTPIRGSVNTAFNVTAGTLALNMYCCITGFTSAN